ncbi:hypothetical protein NA57DRAFT_80544 [Rhizodiscina lignyota]|uniref:Uncharacterized protein n=1 Tax=Rhizodiscina lignyota TaxID=1504668 RepID=A0A9P4I9A7_9PEZI|nr:hypothetical protein NA57DRAFT_80544 [Rhizodiscina lignyota]
MAHGCLSCEEAIYDSLHPQFHTIIRSATELLALDSDAKPTEEVQRPTFSLEMGIIWSLCWTVYKCRDPHARRQALALLRKAPREGVWIGDIQACIAERVIEIEEAPIVDGGADDNASKHWTCKDIPEWHRIHGVDVTLDKPNRLIAMTYSRRLNGIDGEWNDITEWLKY